MNRIDKFYDETTWRPSFYMNGWEPEHIEGNKHGSEDTFIQDHIELDIPIFLSKRTKKQFGDHDNVYYFNKRSLNITGNNIIHQSTPEEVEEMPIQELEEFWSDNVQKVVYEYYAMYLAAQLAVFMGFNRLYFIGCDLGYSYQDPHMVFNDGLDPYRYPSDKTKLDFIRKSLYHRTLIKSIVNVIIMKLIRFKNPKINAVLSRWIDADDQDHFTSNYALKIRDKTVYNEDLRKSHIAIKRICESRGIKTYNATVGGELDIYQRTDVEDAI
jgi:hypothetical protein